MFRIASRYIYIYFFLLCVENSWIEYRQLMIITMHNMICHVCLFPLLVTSITLVILRPSVIDSRLLAVTFLTHWILDPDLCKITPQNKSGSEDLRSFSFDFCFFFPFFLFLYISTSLAFSPFQTLKGKLELPLTLWNLDLPRPNLFVIWCYMIIPIPTISFGRTDWFAIICPKLLWQPSHSSRYKTMTITLITSWWCTQPNICP